LTEFLKLNFFVHVGTSSLSALSTCLPKSSQSEISGWGIRCCKKSQILIILAPLGRNGRSSYNTFSKSSHLILNMEIDERQDDVDGCLRLVWEPPNLPTTE
jgi:hypothetical protein